MRRATSHLRKLREEGVGVRVRRHYQAAWAGQEAGREDEEAAERRGGTCGAGPQAGIDDGCFAKLNNHAIVIRYGATPSGRETGHSRGTTVLEPLVERKCVDPANSFQFARDDPFHSTVESAFEFVEGSRASGQWHGGDVVWVSAAAITKPTGTSTATATIPASVRV